MDKLWVEYKRIGADSMKNKNNLGGNRNISEKTCSFIYFKSDYDRFKNTSDLKGEIYGKQKQNGRA